MMSPIVANTPFDAASDAAPQSSMANRVLFWGTYDLSKARTRILRNGLKETDTDLVEIHAEVWPNHADKSQMGVRTLAIALIRALLWYPVLITRFLRSPADAVVIVPYLGALDVLVLWPFAKLRGQDIVWDMFLSLYDTVVNDRHMVSRHGPAANLLWAVEWLAARAADKVLLDTEAHADYIAELFGLTADKTAAVPVGAELEQFPRLDPAIPDNSRPKVLFYGQLIPLHGIETILAAALSARGQGIDWHIIGTGQDRPKLEAALANKDARHVTWEEWLPYTSLVDAIAASDICLGIFGASRKAASVVPNKVYQSLFAGRAVITRASPAIIETFTPGQGLTLVPHSDPDALLDAIERSQAEGYAPMPLDQLQNARPKDIAERFKRIIANSNQVTG
ncbi:glycosyltransferase [Rhodobacteraceae bacterium]|nr:glycosyltransferase [Paracoccaceae bacterium]